MGINDDIYQAFGEGILASWGHQTSGDNPHRTHMRKHEAWAAGYVWGEKNFARAEVADSAKRREEVKDEIVAEVEKRVPGLKGVMVTKKEPEFRACSPKFLRGQAWDATKCVRQQKRTTPYLLSEVGYDPYKISAPSEEGFYNVKLRPDVEQIYGCGRKGGFVTVFFGMTGHTDESKIRHCVFDVGDAYPGFFEGEGGTSPSVSYESMDESGADYQVIDIHFWSDKLPDPPGGLPTVSYDD